MSFLFNEIKGSVYHLHALESPNYQLLFFLCVHEREGNALAVSTQRHEDQHRPIGYYSQQLDLVPKGPPPIVAPANLLQQVEELIMGFPLALSVPHKCAFLNSHHTQHLSVSRLPS